MSERIKETENGRYKFVNTNPYNSDEGFWSKIEDNPYISHRMPFDCPGCGCMFYNKDDSYYFKWGVCGDCYINFLEGRDDLNLKTNENRASYCKSKVLEKKSSKVDSY
jgi:hypothetical protein